MKKFILSMIAVLVGTVWFMSCDGKSVFDKFMADSIEVKPVVSYEELLSKKEVKVTSVKDDKGSSLLFLDAIQKDNFWMVHYTYDILETYCDTSYYVTFKFNDHKDYTRTYYYHLSYNEVVDINQSHIFDKMAESLKKDSTSKHTIEYTYNVNGSFKFGYLIDPEKNNKLCVIEMDNIAIFTKIDELDALKDFFLKSQKTMEKLGHKMIMPSWAVYK